MTTPIVRVVGLGPGDLAHVTSRTLALLRDAPLVRLRTSVHPAAVGFDHVTSYDDWYDRASSFDELYASIADDLAGLAATSPNGEVVYAVPGSPVVAERTVELLRERSDVTVVCEPAVSVIDAVCAVLGRDPMGEQLRIIDALSSSELLRGPGPLLLLQTYAPEVLATVADRLPPPTPVIVLHHVGLDDEVITVLPASELATFAAADHLTSLWIDGLRTAGEATDDLVDFTRRLRRECPWDQEQTHASLTRHLLEEAYETLDALESFVRLDADDNVSDDAIAHLQEELGDLLFQIVFHAELGDEEGLFNFATIADALRDKLTGRHPHVFGDVHVNSADEVATRWEVIKRDEKGRESVTDGIAWQLPALSLYTKLLSKARLVDPVAGDVEEVRSRAIAALRALTLPDDGASDASSMTHVDAAWGDVLSALAEAALRSGIDLEGVLRDRAISLAQDIRRLEESKSE